MLDFLSHLWFWLLACFVVGVGAGLLTRRAPKEGAVARWLIWSGLAFAAGVIVAALGVLTGGASLFLESALGAFAAFLLGAAGGTLAAGGSLREHEGWALGLIPAGLIWWGATLFAQPGYQDEIQRKIVALATRAGVDATGLRVTGRDVSAPPAIAQNAALMDEIARASGVRRVVAAAEPTTPARPATPPDAEKSAPPAPPAAPRVEAPARGDAAKARDVLAALPAEGAFDRETCQTALAATVTFDPITFREASARIRREAAMALDKIAVLARRCPDVTIEIGGHADSVGATDDNLDLSQRRAEAALRYLRREGVGRVRLTATGHGAGRPSAPNDEESGRAQNRKIDFLVK